MKLTPLIFISSSCRFLSRLSSSLHSENFLSLVPVGCSIFIQCPHWKCCEEGRKKQSDSTKKKHRKIFWMKIHKNFLVSWLSTRRQTCLIRSIVHENFSTLNEQNWLKKICVIFKIRIKWQKLSRKVEKESKNGTKTINSRKLQSF